MKVVFYHTELWLRRLQPSHLDMSHYSLDNQSLLIDNSQQISDKIKDYELDIGLVEANLFDSALSSSKWLQDEMVVVCATDHPLSDKKYLNIHNEFVLDYTPINIFKLIEKINIEFLKLQFNSQSEVTVKNYTIDLNSRKMLKNNINLKLTEKEINTISYLSKSEKPVSIDELQEKVWSYQSDMETHTVETHIYRLRKKILNTFNDNEFIISKKNGYQIK